MSTLTVSTISNGVVSTSSANVIQGSAKAWVTFTSTTTPTVLASYNVSSMTYNGSGDYTVNFTSAFADANYSAISQCGTPGGNRAISLSPFTGVSGVVAGSCRLKYYDTVIGQGNPGTAYSPGSNSYAAFFR